MIVYLFVTRNTIMIIYKHKQCKQIRPMTPWLRDGQFHHTKSGICCDGGSTDGMITPRVTRPCSGSMAQYLAPIFSISNKLLISNFHLQVELFRSRKKWWRFIFAYVLFFVPVTEHFPNNSYKRNNLVFRHDCKAGYLYTTRYTLYSNVWVSMLVSYSSL